MLTKLEGNNKRWLFDPDLEGKYTEIEIQLKRYGINDYKFNNDGILDVNGSVNLGNKNLNKFPFKFGKVSGDFYCNNNKLISLEGAPTLVNGIFDCSENNLTSLKGGPIHVNGIFDCSYNNITSLEGVPKYVGDDFYCFKNKNQFTEKNVREVCDVEGEIEC